MILYILFVIGFVLLIKGADWLVDGSRNLALRFGISELLIGITIVSWGTSMPELIVSLIAGIQGVPNLAIGNVLGSNIANILLILGATAVVRSLPVHRNTVLSEIPFTLSAALLIGFLANTSFIHGSSDLLYLNRLDGVIILFFFLLFMVYVFKIAREEKLSFTETSEVPAGRLWKPLGLIVVGCVGLYFGGKWVVEGATEIALSFGLSENFIGLTIVALGTSLPELVTSIRAALRNNTDIAIGNIVGSNIFNLLWILGVCSVVNPIRFDVASNFDILVVIGASALVILALVVGRKLVIGRKAGVLFVLSYLAYIIWLVITD